MKKIWLLLFILLPVVGMGQVITTYAGPSITSPGRMAFDRHGNLYVSSHYAHRILKIDPWGVISTVAGTGTSGFSGDGGPATNARLDKPLGIIFDSVGNFLFADDGNHRIRKVNTSTGIITTLIGTGVGTFSGDGSPASTAALKYPTDLCFDKIGNLYIADWGNNRLRKVSTAGIISTVAGVGIMGSSGNGGPATNAKCCPNGVCIDSSSNLFITDFGIGLNSVRKIDAFGIISTIAGDTATWVYNGDGIPATNANLDPYDVAFSQYGSLFISDMVNNRIREIDAAGIIHTVAGNGSSGFSGDGGASTAAELQYPCGIVFDTCGNLYICDDRNYRIRKVTFHPSCSTLSINDIVYEVGISIYPNPATTELTISAPGKIREVGVYDVTTPRPLLKTGGEMLRNLTSGREISIDISRLSPGVYLVKVVGEDGSVLVRRWVKE